ncbi:MAG: hypothetical protein KGH61_04660 [Candidatus Micrarchaeota archaeon]|nr:hypothetical protein [Candidatus Micrarchaeota archaeon]MDE1848209.1 hypothetical protein [Candidatus Micrarchaeota archaeon]MDE1864857.1 hypothetical protein [Candidatus Micrarchaeota archaeon]
MNYNAYARRRRMEIMSIRIRIQRLFSFLDYSDFEGIRKALEDAEAILRKYEAR